MSTSKPTISKKPLITKKPIAVPETKKPEVKAAPKQIELKEGSVCKSGMWMIESFRESDKMYIIVPTPENKQAMGRVPMDIDGARAQMEK